MNKLILLTLLLFNFLVASAQTDTVSVSDTVTSMHWNLYNFYGTPSANNPNRIASIRAVLKYVKPDIFTMNELKAESGADIILNQVLNTQGETRYRRANFISSGGDSHEMLFYRSDKFRFNNVNVISSSPRGIAKYSLTYLPQGSAPILPNDTVVTTYYVLHPKASNTPADEASRTATAQLLMEDVRYSVPLSKYKHFFLHGDLNVYNAQANSYVVYTNQGNTRTFRDVKENSWAMINYTQSPRQTSFDGGVNGGLDDRFDFMLCSPDVITGVGGNMQILPSTYRAVGNDGTNFNGMNINARTNLIYPDSVVNGVYYGSDHLPVTSKYKVNRRILVSNKSLKPSNSWATLRSVNPTIFTITSASNGAVQIQIFDLSGKLVSIQKENSNEVSLPILNSGMYFLKAQMGNNLFTSKFIVTK